MESVSIVIVNFNGKGHLINCLESIRAQTYRNLEVIVVDNGSCDGSQELLRANYPDVKLISNRANHLFCRAQNQGIRASKGQYILSLNNDVILDSTFVEKLVEAASLDEMIGIVSGKVLSMNGSVIDSTGQFPGRSKKPIERGYKEADIGQYEKEGYVFGAGGVAPFYRRQMLEDIRINGEFFDESYGIFYEDLDISWRANLYGWRGFYAPRAIAYHQRGGTVKLETKKPGLLESYNFPYLPRPLKAHLIKNRYLTMLKNASIKEIIVDLPYIILYDLKLWGYILFFTPYLILDTIRNVRYIRDALIKRKIIQQRRLNKVANFKFQ